LTRLSWALDAACRLLQPVTIRGHTLRATDPRTRAELSPRYSPAPTDAGCVGLSIRRRTEDQRATVRTRRLAPPCSTCVDESNRGSKRRSEGGRAFFERFARALLFDASGTRVTGSIVREVWRTSRVIAPAETHLGSPLAKGDLFGRIRVPSSATEPLRERRSEPLRARQDRCPVTPPRGEALLGSTVAPLLPLLHRLPLTREAIEAARPDDPRGNESSTERRDAAPVTASTTESARGLMCPISSLAHHRHARY